MWHASEADEEGSPGRRGPILPGAAASAVAALLLAWGAGAAPDQLRAQESDSGDYAVERGDTLWDIARRLLDDPFRWQEIYSANRGLLSNPDRIYPGQELTIPGRTAARGRPGREGGRRDRAAGRDTVPAQRRSLFHGGRRPESGESSVGFAAEERPPLRPISRTDVLGSPFLARPAELGARGRILGPVTAGERPLRAWHARVGDRVRVRLRDVRASGGDTLYAVRTGRSVAGGERVMKPLALLAVESAGGETAIARVTDVFGLVQPGESVVRFPVPPAPAGIEFRPAEREIGARLLALVGGGELLHDGSLVFLDAGRSDGVRPGDVFVVDGADDAGEGRADEETSLIAVRVRGKTSTVRVLQAGDGSVRIGARARLARRLAGSGR